MNNLDNCLICLEYINKEQIVYPKYCKCKIKLHNICLKQIENNGLLCPICRKKALINHKSPFDILLILYIFYIFIDFLVIFYQNYNFINLMISCYFVFIIITIIFIFIQLVFDN